MSTVERTGMETGLILYDDKTVVARLNGRNKKVIAFIQFAGLNIDISNAVTDALERPTTYRQMSDNCWKKILKRINQSKDNPAYSAVLTRMSVGNGYNTLRNRMNQIVDMVYYNWYTPAERFELERQKHEKNYYTDFLGRVN